MRFVTALVLLAVAGFIFGMDRGLHAAVSAAIVLPLFMTLVGFIFKKATDALARSGGKSTSEKK